MTKKWKVPEVLWRLFQNRARTLAETILYLIRPPLSSAAATVQCLCKGKRKCLRCCDVDERMSFLLREDDPSDYRKLVDQCFVVVSDNAPPLPPYDPHSRWSQLEIVRRTIEMILSEQTCTANIICTSYDKSYMNAARRYDDVHKISDERNKKKEGGFRKHNNRSSSIVETLTTAAWSLLLERVGDSFMVYLLKYSSIFMPITRSKHHQVAGVAISDFCWKLLRHTSVSKSQHSSCDIGFRERFHEVDPIYEKVDCPLSYASCVGCNDRSSLTPCRKLCKKKCSNRSSRGDAVEVTDANCSGTTQEKEKQPEAQCRKRLRPYAWQRKSKRRQLSSQNTHDASCSLPKEKVKSMCLCCSGLQRLCNVPRDVQINRRSILYKLERTSSTFPRKHILNSLQPNVSGANAIFKNIFGLTGACKAGQSTICSHSNDIYSIGTTCLYHSLHKQLKILIRRARHCRHWRLLNKHCAIPSSGQKAGGSSASNFEVLPLQPQDLYCQKKQVVSFIWATCRAIVPRELLGSPSNWRIIRKNISTFIRLRKYEKFSLQHCMRKLKTPDFPFLSDKHSLCYLSNNVQNLSREHAANLDKQCGEISNVTCILKQRLLERWIYWFFTCLVVPLIQANFYVTESEHGKQEVFFYRKSIWKKLMKSSISRLKNQCYSLLDEAAVRKIASSRAFGFSRVRLLPKANGIRPLANLKSSSRLHLRHSSWKADNLWPLRHPRSHPRGNVYKYFKAVNVVLRDLHAALKDVQLSRPDKLGSSVFNYKDVYRKLRHFLSDIKRGLPSLPSVFMVVADVEKAYDSIDQDMLLHLMKDVITDDHLLHRSHQVVATKNYMHVCQNINLSRQFSSYVHADSCHSVLVTQNCCTRARKEDLHFNLQEHVKRNLLQIDKKFYLQNVGIAQGSILSSLLCSFYYGHMENSKLIPFLDKTSKSGFSKSLERLDHHDISTALSCSDSAPQNLLVRFTDDFLFISTSKKQALAFFSRLQRGFCEYNCNMNGEKFGLSFDVDKISGPRSNRLYISDNGNKFLRWSGLLINCKTLEVQADYIRYLDNHLSSTLTVRWQGDPGRHFRGKLCDYMRPKCHAIFYDSNINSAAVVRLNIYQSFLLCAMKFHCYICNLSDICRLNHEFLMSSIHNSLRYMFKSMKKRIYTVGDDPDFRPIMKVKREEVQWLGLTAYIQVLKRKQTRYKNLLPLMDLKLNSLNVGRVSPALEYAIDKSNSSILWKIKY